MFRRSAFGLAAAAALAGMSPLFGRASPLAEGAQLQAADDARRLERKLYRLGRAAKVHPQGPRECERRRRQIAAGQLRGVGIVEVAPGRFIAEAA